MKRLPGRYGFKQVIKILGNHPGRINCIWISSACKTNLFAVDINCDIEFLFVNDLYFVQVLHPLYYNKLLLSEKEKKPA